MSQAVKRACDACHRRKVKCDGINPCRNCSSAQLGCTYNAIPQKKGPKGSRAKVISELRETQRQTSLAAKVHSRIQGFQSPHSGPSQLPQPGLVTADLVKDCLGFFFDHVYGQVPIIDRATAQTQVAYMDQDRDSFCLLTALSAFVMLQPGKAMPLGAAGLGSDPFGLDFPSPAANLTSSTLLMEEAVRVRKGYDYTETRDGCVSLNTLATNFFLFGCCYGIESHAKAWYYLREATTMIQMGNMHKEETYLKWDEAEASRRRRLYWLFYIAERAYALRRGRPLTLQATIKLPTMADESNDPQFHHLGNFILQANLFRAFDDPLTATWNRAAASLGQADVASSQKQLNSVLHSCMVQDHQAVDLHANVQWLKSTSWQLSHLEEPFQFELARELRVSYASTFPNGAILADSGLIETMFELSHQLADYLSLQPASRHPLRGGLREQLPQMLNIVAVIRNGGAQFMPLLLHKLHDILPRLASPMLANPPSDPFMPQLGSVDIFDGFGGDCGGGMAAGPHIGSDPMAIPDRKYCMASSYDKQYQMLELNTSPSDSGIHSEHSASPLSGISIASAPRPPPPLPDLGSQYIGSPDLEFSPGLADFAACSPMTDMVMAHMVSPIAPPMAPAMASPMAPQPPLHHHGLEALQGHHHHNLHHLHHLPNDSIGNQTSGGDNNSSSSSNNNCDGNHSSTSTTSNNTNRNISSQGLMNSSNHDHGSKKVNNQGAMNSNINHSNNAGPLFIPPSGPFYQMAWPTQ